MVGLKTDSNMWKVRLLNILCNLLVLPVRYVRIMIQRRLGVLCAFETLFQVQTNFNGIFVDLKPTTESLEAMNITCNHKDS